MLAFCESLLYSGSMDSREKVKLFIEKQNLVEKGDRILLGLSGGADSVCLFYLLLELREELGFMLRAAHIHHGIRTEADEDAAYVKALCEKEHVFCYTYREDVPAFAKKQRLGEEEAGRLLRYRDFEKSLEAWQKEEAETENAANLSAYKIAAAHHLNDQAETVLFQLFRGCGLSGLRGILPRRDRIIRPLLCLLKEEIELYLQMNGIAWREDETNVSEEYSRNKIRSRILPYAEEEICFGAAAHIGKTAEIVREAEEYIKKQTETAYRGMAVEQAGGIMFDIASLRREDVFLQKQLLLYGFSRILEARKDIGAMHIEDILQLAGKQGNGELFLPDHVRVRKVYESLFLSRDKEETSAVFPDAAGFLLSKEKPDIRMEQIDLSKEDTVKKRFGIRYISEIMECIPQKTYTKWLDCDKIKMPFSVRHREEGDFLTIDGAMNKKSLHRYLIEQKIPAAHRDKLWLLADASHVIWVPGGRISAYYKVTEQTKTILQVQICKEE